MAIDRRDSPYRRGNRYELLPELSQTIDRTEAPRPHKQGGSKPGEADDRTSHDQVAGAAVAPSGSPG